MISIIEKLYQNIELKDPTHESIKKKNMNLGQCSFNQSLYFELIMLELLKFTKLLTKPTSKNNFIIIIFLLLLLLLLQQQF